MYDLYLYRCRFFLLGAPLIDTGSKLWQTMLGKFKSRMTDKYLFAFKILILMADVRYCFSPQEGQVCSNHDKVSAADQT